MDSARDILGEIIELLPLDKAEDVQSANELRDGFVASMRCLAAGVGVVTVGHGDRLAGITATSITSLSISPPSILVSIRAESGLVSVLREQAAFTAHLLSEGQRHQADVFAGHTQDGPRHRLVQWEEPEQGRARLAGAIAHIDCRLASLIPVYTHLLAVGVIQNVRLNQGRWPLVYFDRKYNRLADDNRT